MDELFQQLLIPLLGGFLFLIVNHYFRYLWLTTSGEKIFLISALLGAGGLVVASLLVPLAKLAISLIGFPELTVNISQFWRSNLPFSPRQSVVLLGLPLLGGLLNSRCSRDRAFSLAIRRMGDNLEMLLDKSMTNREKVLITLVGGRVYVGIVSDTFRALASRRHVRLIPFMSGYRVPLDVQPNTTADPGTIKFTTFYHDLVAIILRVGERSASDNGKENSNRRREDSNTRTVEHEGRYVEFDPDAIGIVVPLDQIETATSFDEEVYAYLNRERLPEVWKTVAKRQSGDATSG